MNKRNILFIVNSISGGRSKNKVKKFIFQCLDQEKFNWELQVTKYAGHASEILKSEAEKYFAVIAMGGDGTINEIARELNGSNIALGIVPMGSGNGLARHLKIPLNTKKALTYLNDALVHEVDTCQMNSHFFVSIAGVGFDSLIAAEFAKQKGRGFVNYAKLTIREFFRYQENDYVLQIDGKKYQRKAHLVSFANANQFGYHTIISPKADLADGLVDVCIIRKPKLGQLPLLFWQIFTGHSDRSPLVEIILGKDIKLWPNHDHFANIDGESVEVEEKIHVKLHTKSLKILIQKNEFYGKEKKV